jgi:hypothetical protein
LEEQWTTPDRRCRAAATSLRGDGRRGAADAGRRTCVLRLARRWRGRRRWGCRAARCFRRRSRRGRASWSRAAALDGRADGVGRSRAAAVGDLEGSRFDRRKKSHLPSCSTRACDRCEVCAVEVGWCAHARAKEGTIRRGLPRETRAGKISPERRASGWVS